MYYKVELICHHALHQCRCRHNIATQINQQDLASDLIRHNPALLKYLGKRNTISPPQQQQQLILNKVIQVQNSGKYQQKQPYRSITQEKNLRFVLNDNFVDPKATAIKQEQTNKVISQNIKEKQLQKQEDPRSPPKQVIITNNAKQKKVVKNEQEEKIKKHHKQLKNQSRYLSDTAFRKYFDRQCFQNYGRNNTSHKADGFVYGNYLKTFNINPHSGQNMPLDQQTFYHALVSASPDKLALYSQQLNHEHSKQKRLSYSPIKQDQLCKSLQKDKLNIQKLVSDNQKHNKIEKKYDHLKLRQLNQNQKAIKSMKQLPVSKSPKGPSHLQINTKKNFTNHLGNPNLPISPKSIQKEQVKRQSALSPTQFVPNTKTQYYYQNRASIADKEQINTKNQVSYDMNPNVNSQVASQRRIQVASPKSQYSCNHSQNQQSVDCACCLNQMKRMIIDLADRDPQLADRIINSAKKATIYKNYSLNNYDNAAMNPKNYRNVDGKLNIYQN